MYYEIITLDKRHSWNTMFKCMVQFRKASWTGTGVIDFDRARRWFNQTYGWSQDVETRLKLIQAQSTQDINPYWAYSVQYKDYRIYVATEKELTMFLLANPLHTSG